MTSLLSAVFCDNCSGFLTLGYKQWPVTHRPGIQLARGHQVPRGERFRLALIPFEGCKNHTLKVRENDEHVAM